MQKQLRVPLRCNRSGRKGIVHDQTLAGDVIEYMTRGIQNEAFAVESLRYEDGIEAISAPTEETVMIKAPEGPRKGDLIWKIRLA